MRDINFDGEWQGHNALIHDDPRTFGEAVIGIVHSLERAANTGFDRGSVVIKSAVQLVKVVPGLIHHN